jgi:hypothetical protein
LCIVCSSHGECHLTIVGIFFVLFLLRLNEAVFSYASLRNRLVQDRTFLKISDLCYLLPIQVFNVLDEFMLQYSRAKLLYSTMPFTNLIITMYGCIKLLRKSSVVVCMYVVILQSTRHFEWLMLCFFLDARKLFGCQNKHSLSLCFKGYKLLNTL